MRHLALLAFVIVGGVGCAHQSRDLDYKYGQDSRPYLGKPSYLQASAKSSFAPRLMCDSCAPTELQQPAEQGQPVLQPPQDPERPE